MEHKNKEAAKKQSWIIPITAVLISVIIGGSFFASQYYKQKSEEKQQRVELDAEAKKAKINACIERNKLSAERVNTSGTYNPFDHYVEKCE